MRAGGDRRAAAEADLRNLSRRDRGFPKFAPNQCRAGVSPTNGDKRCENTVSIGSPRSSGGQPSVFS
jgi:hypothetical protein